MVKDKPTKLVKLAESKPERNAKGQLLPGNTANPNGRPSTGTALSDLLRGKLSAKLADLYPNKYAEDKRTVNEAIVDAVIEQVLTGRDPTKSAALVFDRLEGKAHQSIAVSRHEPDTLLVINDDD